MNELILVTLYTMLIWGATYYYSRGYTNTKKEFLVANREIGTFSGALSVAATWIWAPALFVSATKAYTSGIPGLFWFTVPNVLCLCLFGYFANRLRELVPDGFTLSAYIRDTVSPRVQKLYWGEMGYLTISSFAIQLLAGGLLLNKMTGVDFWLITVVMAGIALSYSLFSGIKGSVVTDCVQMIIIGVVCLFLVPWAIIQGGGWETVAKGATGSIFDLDVFLTFGIAVSIGLLAGPFGDQMFYQRAFSIRKEKIKSAFLWGAGIFAIVPISMGILGFLGTGLGLQVPAGLVNYEVIKELLPVWAVYPFLFAVMCGLLSTCDSAMCAISSIAVNDWFPKTVRPVYVARIAMGGLAVLAITVANTPGVAIVHLFLFHSTFRACTLLPTIQAVLYRDVHEPTMFWGIVVSLIFGFPLFCYGMLFGGGWMFIAPGAIITAGASGLIVYAGRKFTGARVNVTS